MSSVWNYLHRLGFTRKKLETSARERNEDERLAFRVRMSQYEPWQLVFMDESAADDRTLSRRYGYSPRGFRAPAAVPFIRGKKISLLAAMSVQGLEAWRMLEGSYNADEFVALLQERLLDPQNPVLHAYPGPNSVVVTDNVRFHHDPRVRQILQNAGIRLVYLPPYSPDLDPIEHCFFFVKQWLRRNNEWAGRQADLMGPIDLACRSVTDRQARACYRGSGYLI